MFQIRFPLAVALHYALVWGEVEDELDFIEMPAKEV